MSIYDVLDDIPVEIDAEELVLMLKDMRNRIITLQNRVTTLEGDVATLESENATLRLSNYFEYRIPTTLFNGDEILPTVGTLQLIEQ